MTTHTASPHADTAPAQAAEGVSRADVRAVNKAEARSLYKSREPIYPKLVHGRFRLIKWAFLAVALTVYYGLPWIRWPRGPGEPAQAVLADFGHGRFYFFWIEIWPQEVYYITGLLILAAFGLFLVTALFGRVWCGYACPQTVWTDLFIAVERLIEGDRSARIRLDKQPWTLEKLWRKGAKHVAWVLIAAATGGAFIFYWHDAPATFVGLFTGTAPLSAYGFLALLTATTYLLAGWAREQVCIYMCPWPRIQAAMTDEESLAVTYRRDRGEPRGPHRKGEPWQGRGDCIDCHQCVAACPMGIDIRDGAQLECINCALCIDACDEVMTRIGRPRGLVSYDTDKNIDRRARKERTLVRFVRPRTILYAALIVIVSVIMLAGLATRTDVQLNVVHDRAPPFVTLSDGAVRNAYTVRIVNRDNRARSFRMTVEGLADLQLRSGGGDPANSLLLSVAPDGVTEVRVLATVADGTGLPATTPIAFRIVDEATGAEAGSAQVFLAGGR